MKLVSRWKGLGENMKVAWASDAKDQIRLPKRKNSVDHCQMGAPCYHERRRAEKSSAKSG